MKISRLDQNIRHPQTPLFVVSGLFLKGLFASFHLEWHLGVTLNWALNKVNLDIVGCYIVPLHK